MPLWPNAVIRPKLRIALPHKRIAAFHPKEFLFGIAVLAVLFILGGNLYTLIETPPPITGSPDGLPRVFAPGIDAQLSMEGMMASIVAGIGVLGLGIIYYSSRYVFTPSHATRLMILGMLLSGVAFLIYNYMFAIKLAYA